MANTTSVAEFGFAIPPPYPTLREFTERNYMTEQPGKGTELRTRILPKPGGGPNETMECLFPVYAVFLKHYVWRSFEEFKAHRGQSRVKSDGQWNTLAVEDPHGAWLEGANPRMYGGPCSEAYYNDFTALIADKTRANLAARRERWDKAHKIQTMAAAELDDYDYEAWIREGECGTGPGVYSGPFPPVEDWVIR